MALEDRAFEIDRRDIEIVAAIARHDLGRHRAVIVDRFESVDMARQHQRDIGRHRALWPLAAIIVALPPMGMPSGPVIAAQIGRWCRNQTGAGDTGEARRIHLRRWAQACPSIRCRAHWHCPSPPRLTPPSDTSKAPDAGCRARRVTRHPDPAAEEAQTGARAIFVIAAHDHPGRGGQSGAAGVKKSACQLAQLSPEGEPAQPALPAGHGSSR